MSIKTGKGFGMSLRTVYNTGYYRYMQFKQNIKLISGNQIIQEKINIINFFNKHGPKVTKEAYGVSRSTVFRWKKIYKDSKYNSKALLNKSTKPHVSRRMIVDQNVLSFIQDIKNSDYPLGKSKIKPLLDAHCLKLGIDTISESLIGKILKRNNLTFKKSLSTSLKGITKRRSKKKERLSSRYKAQYTGEVVQIDTVVRFDLGIKRYLVTAVDLYSRFSFAYTYTQLSSRIALDFFNKLEEVAPFKVNSVKTDNGLEFHGEFDTYLIKNNITHFLPILKLLSLMRMLKDLTELFKRSLLI